MKEIDPKTFLPKIVSLLKQGDNAIELEMETQFNSAEENKKRGKCADTPIFMKCNLTEKLYLTIKKT